MFAQSSNSGSVGIYSYFNKELRQVFLAITEFQQKKNPFLFEMTIKEEKQL